MRADGADEIPVEEDDIVDYEEGKNIDGVANEPEESVAVKGSYAGIHSSSFRDCMLKSELLRAVTDCGFEHPSEVQQECIPQAVLGMDIICQAKSGMGKTAVFVLACLQNLEPVAGQVDTLVLCHTRELAYQICKEFNRFSRYLPEVVTGVFIGGIKIQLHYELIKTKCPNVVIGTPGRVCQLVKEAKLNLSHLKRFVLDECDEMLGELKMRKDVQTIFKATPHEKQVMMFSATLNKKMRAICHKFTQTPQEIFVDDAKLTLHGLQQYYVKLAESGKNRKLNDLLDALEFNQVVIFVNGVRRAKELNKLLNECNFPSVAMHSSMSQEERLQVYNDFKDFKSRILVSTDIFGRGVDFERVNIVINYDMPKDDDAYLHRVGRSGRFGTKGLAISFVADAEAGKVLESVQERFEVAIDALPDHIEPSTYISA